MLVRAINVAALLVVGAAVISMLWILLGPDDSVRTYDLADRRVPAEFLEAVSAGRRLGHQEAPVVLLVYSDYHCSFCREFDIVLEEIRKRYPDHLAVVAKPFAPVGTGSAARIFLAAECAADQGVFERFHSAALRLSGPGGRVLGWRSVADAVGIPDRAVFERCVTTAQYSQQIEAAYDEGRRLGVIGTPTFFVNGVRYSGAYRLPALDSIIASALPRRSRIGQIGGL